MALRTLFAAVALMATVTGASFALSHEAAKGRNGGWRVDAGKYHVELVADGSTTVVVHLSDADDKPIPATGFKVNAILVVDGKSQRFPLAPAEGSKLVGTAPVAIKPGVKGVLQLTAPDGTTAQGKL
jgi:hypothetical protein